MVVQVFPLSWFFILCAFPFTIMFLLLETSCILVFNTSSLVGVGELHNVILCQSFVYYTSMKGLEAVYSIKPTNAIMEINKIL